MAFRYGGHRVGLVNRDIAHLAQPITVAINRNRFPCTSSRFVSMNISCRLHEPFGTRRARQSIGELVSLALNAFVN